MKKEIEIEKWFRAKGTDKYFKSKEEAVEYANKELKKEILISLKSEIRLLKQTVARNKQLETMIAEAKSKTVDLREAWKTVERIQFDELHSNNTRVALVLPFQFNWNSKKDLRFLREYVESCCKSQIKKNIREIRYRKERVKCWQRKYGELEV